MNRRLRELLSGASLGAGDKPIMINEPLLVMFEQEGRVICHIHSPKAYNHKHYGVPVCDLVRHLARAFKVEEEVGGCRTQ
jgi:hypothetical protein